MSNLKLRKLFWKTWNFIVHEDSLASFAVDAILIVIIGKFVLFPLIAAVTGSAFPVVAVISGSMDHQDMSFESWWASNQEYYEKYNIKESQFEGFYLNEGFNKGDVLVIQGVSEEDLVVGDIIVYSAPGKRDPIIHRTIALDPIQTKGDANFGQISFERDISPEQVHGKAIAKIPYIGWVKVGSMELLGLL
jgi:hypothetical protein